MIAVNITACLHFHFSWLPKLNSIVIFLTNPSVKVSGLSLPSCYSHFNVHPNSPIPPACKVGNVMHKSWVLHVLHEKYGHRSVWGPPHPPTARSLPNLPSCLTAWTCSREIWLCLSVISTRLTLKNLLYTIFGNSCFPYISPGETCHRVCLSLQLHVVSLSFILLLVSVGFRLRA